MSRSSLLSTTLTKPTGTPTVSYTHLLTPAGGEVRVDGVPVTYDRKGLISVRKQVGIVFQDPDDQLFSADVYRDISFGGVNLGLPEEEVRRRVDEAMEWTGVTHLKGKPTHALSFCLLYTSRCV